VDFLTPAAPPACRDCGYPDPRALRRWRPRQTKPWATILLCRKCHARAGAAHRKAANDAAIAAIQRRVSADFTHAKTDASKPLAMLIGVSLASPPSPGLPAQPPPHLAVGPEGTNMKTHYLVAGVLAVALAALASFPAHATLQVAANFGGTTFLCVDNTACDTNLSTGTIQIANQTIGGVTVNGSVQTSVGTPANPNPQDILNTSSLNLINTLGIPVLYTVTISDTNFAAPVTQFAATTAGTWQNAIGSTAQTRLWADATNQQGADSINDTPGTLLDNFTSTALLAADSYSHNASGAFFSANPFSITEQVTGSLSANAQLINRGQTAILENVPEPASMTILGAGLLALAAFRRKLSA
jgi:hypothetical protein